MNPLVIKLHRAGYKHLAARVKRVLSETLVINFRNRNQVVLYECELKEQIDNIHWYNKGPQGHARNMMRAVAKKGKPLGCIGFLPMRAYDFTELLPIQSAAARMIAKVRIANAFSQLTYDQVNDCVRLEEIIEFAKRGTEFFTKKLAHYKELLGAQSDAELQEKMEQMRGGNYKYGNLKKDLTDMSQIVSKGVPLPDPTKAPIPGLPNPTKQNCLYEEMNLKDNSLSDYMKKVMKDIDVQSLGAAVVTLRDRGYKKEMLKVAERMVQLGLLKKKSDALKLQIVRTSDEKFYI